MKPQDPNSASQFNRRDFLKGGSFATLMMMMGGVEITGQTPPNIPKEGDDYEERPIGPPVKLGLIGFGERGRDIVETLPRLPNAPLTAICDSYTPFSRRIQRAAPDAFYTTEYKELLEREDVEAVIIATPSHQHRQIVIDALEAGKHVYCEAPIATSIEDARAIAKAAQAHPNLTFQVGLQFRANPQHLHVMKFIRTGALGRVTMARGQWHKKESWRRISPRAEREQELNWRLNPELSNGLIGEIGIHQIDTASWFLKGLPVSVSGFGDVLHWNDGRQSPDTIQAIVEFPDKVRMAYDSTLTNSFDGSYDMYYGTDSAIMLRDSKAWMFKEVDAPLLGWEVYARKDDFYKETGIALVADATKLVAQGLKPAEQNPNVESPIFYAFEDFLYNINEKVDPPANALVGFQSAVIASKCAEAVREGKKIDFDPEWFKI